jgi:hypothetical protein
MEFLILRNLLDDGTEIDSHVNPKHLGSFKEYGETSQGETTTEIQFIGGGSMIAIISGEDLFEYANRIEKKEQDKLNKQLDDRIDARIKIALKQLNEDKV